MKSKYIQSTLSVAILTLLIGAVSNADAANKTKVKSFAERRLEILEQLKRNSLRASGLKTSNSSSSDDIICKVNLPENANLIVAVITPGSTINPISRINQGDIK